MLKKFFGAKAKNEPQPPSEVEMLEEQLAEQEEALDELSDTIAGLQAGFASLQRDYADQLEQIILTTLCLLAYNNERVFLSKDLIQTMSQSMDKINYEATEEGTWVALVPAAPEDGSDSEGDQP